MIAAHRLAQKAAQQMKNGNPFEAFAFGGKPKPLKAQSASPRDGPAPHKTGQAATASPTAAAAAGCKQHTRSSVTPLPADTSALDNSSSDASPPPCASAAAAAAAALQEKHSPPPNSAACRRTWISEPEAAPAAAAAAAGRKRQRKAYASLTGPPKGLPEKLGDGPLRLILIGHNPSEHAWHTGHYYSNPSNRMWRILEAAGITPPGVSGPEADDVMPAAVGVGFTDVGSGQPGTDSSLFTAADFQQWQGAFYARLKSHMKQASDSIGCTCGRCGAPVLVAFTGKRHYLELLNLDEAGQQRKGKARVASAAVALGPQPPLQLPPGWPLPTEKCEVWVLTSTSGAAPMSNEAREAPYRQLAQRLAGIPWPRSGVHCTG